MRVGKILEVDDIPGARKPIYKLRVDLGELGVRNVALGLKEVYQKEDLIGKYVVVVSNMAPKNVAGFVSEGMLLAAQHGEEVSRETISLLILDKELAPGSIVR